MRLSAHRRSAGTRRGGYVLFAVLLVTVVLSLTAYRFTDSMGVEEAVAVRAAGQTQARLAAASGLHHAAGVLADPSLMAGMGNDPSDNADLFAGQTVGSAGRWKFSLVNTAEALDGGGTGESRYPLRYGVSDEGGKINVNALILKDPTGNLLYTLLLTLPLPSGHPFTIEQVADSIVDWVDPDFTARTNGAEDDYYAGMATPYRCKNGPINSLDELLLVQGVTPQLLYGNDRNRNGKLDANEDDGQEFGRGWSEYLTCYGREINVDSEGLPRLNLNGTTDSTTGAVDLTAAAEGLTALVGAELADYMLYFALFFGDNGGSGKAAAPLTNAQVEGQAADLRDLVAAAIEKGTKPKRKLTSVLDVLGTQVMLPPVPAPGPSQPGQPPRMVTPVVVCPLNDAAVLKQKLAVLLDKCTCEDGVEIAPRININTAPAPVLRALVAPAKAAGLNITDEDVEGFLDARADQDLTSPEMSTGAWLVTQAGMRPDVFKQLNQLLPISGRSWTYRVQSVGYAAPGQAGGAAARGATARMEAVIDVGGRTADGSFAGLPRFLYFRDLTDLGRGFADLP